MHCDACRQPIDEAFYVVDGQTWCPQCQRSVAPARTPAWSGTLGGLAGGVAAAGVALTAVALLPWDSAAIHLIDGTAIPVGLLVGGAVRLGRRDVASPVLPVAAAALTFLVVAICFVYGVTNLDDDGGYVSMTALLMRLVGQPNLSQIVLMPVIQVAMGVLSVVGALSLGTGVYAAFAVARGVPIAIDGPFDVVPEPACPVPAR
jgi:hypothetical protein